MKEADFWQVKVAARLHDPAEKALVLLRDPAGHENGTSLALARLAGLIEVTKDSLDPDREKALASLTFRTGLPRDVYRIVQKADSWAAAADRPNWPMERDKEKEVPRVADWAQVRWYEQAALIHPLSGTTFELPGRLAATEIENIKHRSFAHMADLVQACGAGTTAGPDWHRIALALWRFGPELKEEKDAGKLGELWKLLPADTRVPDHSIWDHLDLVSALAGAFAADPENDAALLIFSIGPVQSFIQAARKTEDLWAGSHLLSRLLWEAARPLCEELGPDAVIYPRLRGIALVDLWLRDQMGLPAQLFHNCLWRNKAPDANPLFSAALPNRFVAIVPASRARELALRCRDEVRRWMLDLGMRTVDRLLEVAGIKEPDTERDDSLPAYEQMRRQLANFPEVHWASTPFNLIRKMSRSNASGSGDLDVSELRKAMAPFYGLEPSDSAGFLATPAWKLLSQELDLPGGLTFYTPQPGVLYPAVYELTDRLLASAKTVRPFDQGRQEGWRCTLTGQAEWLTTDRAHLTVPKSERASGKVETLWTRIAERKPAWAKRGEHLSALPAIKRLWPTLFAEEVKAETGGLKQRFVVSTHTMALAAQLERWLEGSIAGSEAAKQLRVRFEQMQPEPVALPRRLVNRFHNHPHLGLARCIPALLDAARESEDEKCWAEEVRRVRMALSGAQSLDEAPRLETYYGLVLMDGDRMGRILSAASSAEPDPEGPAASITFLESFHPQVRAGFKTLCRSSPALKSYGDQPRPVSPNRHMVISAALTDFSQVVVPHIVEEKHPGRLIYSGGDDVLAMLPASDALPAAQELRWAYSGSFPEHEAQDWNSLRKGDALAAKQGFAWLKGRLMRMMGLRATASCGIVIAHHQAPLSFVLRQLREAERLAKNFRRPDRCNPGKIKERDAVHVTVIKRSGSTLQLMLEWNEQIALLEDLSKFLARQDVSRRAVYHIVEWLEQLPETDDRLDREMLESLLAYQLKRQSGDAAKAEADVLAKRLAMEADGGAALKEPSGGFCGFGLKRRENHAKSWLRNFLCVADFLAREQRVTAGVTP
ncbi:MAG TPA: type III-B CRISPR-associated protein Cas10/Cmr2 [Bryobacteraceae bacterium]|nr:type III-B CRISPR-associated protein Cas10/Cmr2 [Bryobacteraceae bacterium]